MFQLPPDHEEIHIQLPSILHTCNYFLRPVIQLDYLKFDDFVDSEVFQKFIQPPEDKRAAFIQILNSYKSTAPFILLTVINKITFEIVGFAAMFNNNGIVSLCLDIQDQNDDIVEVLTKYINSFGFDQVQVHLKGNLDKSGFWDV
ncbi:hypothetical protein SS50377_20049 [Spironucleus salmonicida]|uniref:Uncharacterized protein n=1 Tax=Spironucleus salmonicida TaxID=348837 RepID=V6LXM2_9EUKA|nr:hypothetical protein SS50377_20049 [Spironucleus salmonicida]|eukprot:EST49382.1 Hypothetical protein SS50377_10307 [Spironucleus salmonicida]